MSVLMYSVPMDNLDHSIYLTLCLKEIFGNFSFEKNKTTTSYNNLTKGPEGPEALT